MLSSTNAKNSLIEVSPLLMLSTHSPLSSSRDSKMSSTTLFHTLRCLPGRGLICNRCQFLKGLNNKTKLTIYKTFGGEVKFKRYLNGVGDAGTRLLFKLRSGTHGLNEELGRHRGREGKYMCNLCGEDCESVGHFLWNCPVYSERRALFLEHLKNNLGNEFEHFKNCDIAGKSHFILGTELWGSRYEELLRLVKSYIIDIWELRKSKLYGSGTGPLQY